MKTHPPAPSSPRAALLRTPLIVTSLVGALVLAGCDNAETPEAPPAATGSPAPATPPAAGGDAPASSAPAPATPPAPSSSATTPGTREGAAASLPSAGQAAPAEGTAVDAKTTNPNAELTKKEESQGLPEANTANNHSSTALDTEPKK
jgi:hypothetical protein